MRRLLVAVAFATSGLALSACNGSGKPQAYVNRWNYAVKLYSSGRHVDVGTGNSGTICDDAAAAAWPSTTPEWLPRSNYQSYDNWDQGCLDAMSYINSSGQNGLQIPFY
jgi:hypothetical protein